MRVLGVDLGSHRVGLARSDPSGMLASPWRVLRRTGDADRDLALLAEAVQESEATTVVIGLPISLDGRHGPAARRATAEIAALREALAPGGLRVETVDERFSTVHANGALRAAGVPSAERRRVVDSAAAAVLLQTWLDRAR